MGAGPTTGETEASLVVNSSVLTLFGTELALPSKDEVFRTGNHPFLGLGTELLSW